MPQREHIPYLIPHWKSNIKKALTIAKFLRDHPPQFDERLGAERRESISLQIPATAVGWVVSVVVNNKASA